MATPRAVLSDSFRFDPERHEYITLDGEVRPHITGILEATGWTDDTWFTEESSERGRCVHALTADYDLGALPVDTCVSRYRNYLLAHVACMRVLQHQWTSIEETFMHPEHRFGGRPDRVGKVRGQFTVLEVKSAVPASSHAIQTALQAILVSARHPLPADLWTRLCLYLKPTGKFSLVEHKDPHDFVEARRIIKACC